MAKSPAPGAERAEKRKRSTGPRRSPNDHFCKYKSGRQRCPHAEREAPTNRREPCHIQPDLLVAVHQHFMAEPVDRAKIDTSAMCAEHLPDTCFAEPGGGRGRDSCGRSI
jgi:hypothetical protein